MLSKSALICSFLFLGATITLLYSCCRILGYKSNEKDGLVILTLSLGNSRRDLLGSVQSFASQATEVGVVASSLMPMITSVAGDAASQATAGVSKVLSGVASLETAALGGILATNYTVGTKYACSASSCSPIPSLEVVLCFALVMTLLSAVSLAMTFCLPRMKLVLVGCSILTMLLFIVFAACVVSITEVAALVGGSTFFHVQKGDVFGTSLCALCGGIILAFSAIGTLCTSVQETQRVATGDSRLNEPRRVVPTWARPMGQQSESTDMVTDPPQPVQLGNTLGDIPRTSSFSEKGKYAFESHKALTGKRRTSRHIKVVTLPAITEISSDHPWSQRPEAPSKH